MGITPFPWITDRMAVIPLITLPPVRADPQDEAAVAARLVDAAADHGFLYIRSTSEGVADLDVSSAIEIVSSDDDQLIVNGCGC